MSTFNDIAGFEAFSITADSDSTITIFANGYQQVRVYVRMIAIDKDRKYVNLSGGELKKLQEAITLINFNNSNLLTKVDKYADGKSDWSYTTTQGEYKQPETKGAISALSSNMMSLTYYVMCPPDENERTIKVAVKLKLSNGKVVDTTGSSGFDSKVSLKANAPTVYNINYRDNRQSENDNLRAIYTRVRSEEINGDPAWVENYTVSIRAGEFLYKRSTPSSAVTSYDSVRVRREHISSWAYCMYFRHYAYTHQIANICYWFSENDTTRNLTVGYFGEVGIGGGVYMENVPANTEQSLFNFSVARFEDTDNNAYSEDIESSTAVDTYIECNFRDQYGNAGTFFAYPHPETGDNYYRGYAYEFLSQRK
ncbi:hypothetical protein BHU62_11930 [Serratia marcescens]|uniref:Uncharacterized protein n=1 Tax=Serratia marcescens TaxID=615 RepID=A0A1Q4P0H0_SERMA|nr:hypothetical protein [Serratia marcescens]OKB66576.1 hypothetical protein BHU62_11930 [Serratia marcescens]